MQYEQTGSNTRRPLSQLIPSLVYKKLLNITSGSLTIRSGDHRYSRISEEPGLTADMDIHEPMAMVRRCLTRGDLGFAESYMAGEWSSSNIDTLLQQLLRNDKSIKFSHMRTHLRRIGSRILHASRSNSLPGSRKNISYHYDLGNDFYRLWLDPSMTYSSALFTDQHSSLETAQNTKYERILDQLNAKKDSTLLEIGCGWGGLLEAATKRGLQAKGITLSKEQKEYADARLQALDANATVELQDYRHVEQQFDHIVSIEMFEAVGEAWWPTYFDCLKKNLKPGGTAVLQVITIDEPLYEKYRQHPDFIQRYIFPGGMLPTKSILNKLVEDAGLKSTDIFSFGKDYARTLELWHKQFERQLASIQALGYDQKFIQMWKYYLAYCRAGFAENTIDVVQISITN